MIRSATRLPAEQLLPAVLAFYAVAACPSFYVTDVLIETTSLEKVQALPLVAEKLKVYWKESSGHFEGVEFRQCLALLVVCQYLSLA